MIVKEQLYEEVSKKLFEEWDGLLGGSVVESDPIDGDYWFKHPDAALPVDTSQHPE